MKTVKSLLLGAAAGFAALTGAQAADLPGKAAPAEYVRICDTYGAGFFFIPGSDTCLRIGGFVRVDYGFNSSAGTGNRTVGSVAMQPVSSFDALYGTNARVNVNLDARSNTEFGLLRAFGEFAAYRGATSASIGSGIHINSGVGASQRQSNILLSRAFIQFAGFTFGYSASFFNFYQGDVSYARPFGATATSTTVLAYTASFGSGVSFTVSAEDAMYRRVGNGDAFVALTAPPVSSALARPLSGVYGLTYGANTIPDIVANLRVDQGWGSVQIMGALHQLRDFGNPIAGAVAVSGVDYSVAATTVQRAGDKWGYAVGAGLRLNLDMLARGDVLWLQAVYADGATDYAFSTANQGGDRQTISGAGNLAQNNSLTAQIRDAAVVANSIRTVQAWSLTAGFRHFWTPAVRSSIFGGYSNINAPAVATGLADVQYWQVGVNTIWSPVRNLDLGLEVVYHNIRVRDQAGAAIAGGTLGTNATVGRTVEGAWTGTLRVQRNF
ncbi:porin [Phreatobacter sp.]|uniref:porin n=1 Tax=Phreatobacter sp. TaxID=1966341 RepID=UPI0022C81204|nr:porin [Phreatobacter sp.]MCZ8314875.1 porin [Phreatobacter sp.]